MSYISTPISGIDNGCLDMLVTITLKAAGQLVLCNLKCALNLVLLDPAQVQNLGQSAEAL
jgi:hypothetical protein